MFIPFLSLYFCGCGKLYCDTIPQLIPTRRQIAVSLSKIALGTMAVVKSHTYSPKVLHMLQRRIQRLSLDVINLSW
jgi:hypothetical protein